MISKSAFVPLCFLHIVELVEVRRGERVDSIPVTGLEDGFELKQRSRSTVCRVPYCVQWKPEQLSRFQRPHVDYGRTPHNKQCSARSSHARLTLWYQRPMQPRHVVGISIRSRGPLSMAFGAWRHYPAVCLEQKHLHNTCPPRIALRTLSTTSTIACASTYSSEEGGHL